MLAWMRSRVWCTVWRRRWRTPRTRRRRTRCCTGARSGCGATPGYQGVGKREENRDAALDWQVAMRPGKRRGLDKAGAQEAAERRKVSVRAKVEHPFLYVKRHFGQVKVRYRGLAKNTQHTAVLLGLSNLLIAGRYATA